MGQLRAIVVVNRTILILWGLVCLLLSGRCWLSGSESMGTDVVQTLSVSRSPALRDSGFSTPSHVLRDARRVYLIEDEGAHVTVMARGMMFRKEIS